jgi:hypothetical protein
MDTKRRRGWAIGGLLFAAAIVATSGWYAWHRFVPPVNVGCNQQEEPDSTGNFAMQFTVKNASRSTIAKLDFRLADTYLDGSPMGEFSHYTLSGNFAPGTTSTRDEDVPQPPHYKNLKFSQIDCTLDRVVFADGSVWP